MDASRHFIGGNFLTRYLKRVFEEIMPRRFKRMFYVGTVIGIVVHDQHPDIRLISKVNETLGVAYKDTGMLFPVYVARMIWKDIESSVVHLSFGTVPLSRVIDIDPEKLTDHDYWKIAGAYAENSPEGLQYGSRELMVHDIYYTLRICKQNKDLCHSPQKAA